MLARACVWCGPTLWSGPTQPSSSSSSCPLLSPPTTHTRTSLRAQVILDLAQDTKDSRERALQLKALKERQAQDRAAQLKEAYLKKQLGRVAAAGAAKGTQQGQGQGVGGKGAKKKAQAGAGGAGAQGGQ